MRLTPRRVIIPQRQFWRRYLRRQFVSSVQINIHADKGSPILLFRNRYFREQEHHNRVMLLLFIYRYGILCIESIGKICGNVIIMLSFYLTLIDEPSDKEKFTEIYEHYKGMMMQKAMSILHNSALAEEAVQESFIKIAKNIFKISSPICSKTASFIVIIVRNTSYDILRREKPDKNVLLDEEISAENIEMPDINEVLSTVGINFILEVINKMDDKGYIGSE